VIALSYSDGTRGTADDAAGGAVGGDEQPLIYSAALDNTIRVWDPYDMATLATMHEQHSEISCMHASPLCDFLITGNDDGSIRLWNPDSGSRVSLTGHTNTITCLDVVMRGNTELLLSGGYDAHVGVWDVAKRKTTMPRIEAMLRAHTQEILCLKANSMNGTFITAGNDKRIHVWSLSNYSQLARLEGHSEPVTCLALDGNFLLSGSEDGSVRVWDMHSYTALASLPIHSAAVEDLLIEPQTGLLVTCATDCSVRVWDYGSARELQVWKHTEEFRCVALRRSSGHVIAGTEQNSIIAFPLAQVMARLKTAAEDQAVEGAPAPADAAPAPATTAPSSQAPS